MLSRVQRDMNEQELRNIIRSQLKSELFEQEIKISPFSEAEEQFLGKFAELKSNNIGILYTNNITGIREFLNRSGKDFNLTPEVFMSLLKNKTISIIPYGGYSRNEDYTIHLNMSYENFEGITAPDTESGAPGAAEAGAMDATGGVTEESIEKSTQFSKLIVSEAKKSKKKKKTKVYTGKSRGLKRLPGGYVNYLERIIQILGEKAKTDMEKEHLVADILDNLAHNFGLTPKQVYRSYIYYKSQNRLANIIKDNND